jgi:hypothetical protein
MAGSHPIRIAISSRAVVAVGEDFNDDAPKHLSLTWPQLNDEASQDFWAAEFELFGREKEGIESSSYVPRDLSEVEMVHGLGGDQWGICLGPP